MKRQLLIYHEGLHHSTRQVYVLSAFLSCGKQHPYVTVDDCVIPQTCKSSFENVHPQPNMGDINQEVRDGSQKESVGPKHDFIDAA